MPADIQEPEQTLDLWTGIVTSRYRLGGVPVTVTTACHPGADVVAVRIESALVRAGKLRVRLAFPRGHDPAVKNTPPLDWIRPGGTRIETGSSADPPHGRLDPIRREVQQFRRPELAVSLQEVGPHAFRLQLADTGSRMEFAIGFSNDEEPLMAFAALEQVFDACRDHWNHFWRTGAAVDFSGSTDPRAAELERRVVLSQASPRCSSPVPCRRRRAGRTCNTWYGKHHTEMIWWHTAHFALWGHDALPPATSTGTWRSCLLRANWRRAAACVGRAGRR